MAGNPEFIRAQIATVHWIWTESMEFALFEFGSTTPRASWFRWIVTHCWKYFL